MGEAPSRPDPRRAAWTATVVAAVSCALPVALHAVGTAARARGTAPGAGPRAVLLPTNAAVVAEWRRRGVLGRTVVHAGRFLHFVDDDVKALTVATLSAPGQGRLLDERLAARADPRNYLAVAASTGVARRVFYVSPRPSLDQRLASLAVDRAALPLRIDLETTPRELHFAPPTSGEPVLLDVNASWFDEAGGEALLAAIEASGLRVELATLSLAEDATDVSPRAREALRAFAAEIARRLGPPP